MLLNYKEEMNQATNNRILLNNGHKLVFEHNPLSAKIQRNEVEEVLSDGVEEVERRLQQEVEKKQIRVKEFFTDYDVLRKGMVQEDKFRSALAMMFKCHIKQNEISQIIEKYRVETDLIDYNSFVKSMHSNDYKLSQSGKVELNDRIRELLLGINHVIKTKRILIKQPFQDYDHTKSSHISRSQFIRVLNQLGLMPRSTVLLEMLLDNYENKVDKQINYVRFCEDVDYIQNVQLQKSNLNNSHQHQSQVIRDLSNLDLLDTLFVSRQLPPLEKVEEIEQKIKAECFMKQIRIKEFFIDYDNLRKGIVSKQQFKRILNINNLKLSDQEIQIIIDKYSINNDQVDYFSFIENIERIFTNRNIEKDPQYQVEQKDKNTTIPARRLYLTMAQQEEEQLDNLIKNYRQKIQNTRVLMKPHFKDFDRQKGGYISKNQFLRILHQFSMMPEEKDLNLLLRKYIDRGNLDQVNYYEFCKDVEIQDEGQRISKNYYEQFESLKDNQQTEQLLNKMHEAPVQYVYDSEDYKQLIVRLNTQVQEKRIRVSEFLKDFDKLRTGMITKQQFRLGLNMCQIQLSDKDFFMIIQKYQSTLNDKILWKEFVDEIEARLQLEQEQLQQTNQSNYHNQKNNEEQNQVGERLKRQINNFIKRQRIELKKFFKDWDRQCRNRVSVKQFRQVLATIKFNMSEYETQCITNMYLTKDGQDVNYQLFIQDCLGEQILDQKIHERNEEQQKLKDKEYANSLIKVGLVDQNVLLNWLKSQIKVNNIRIEEYFRDFDPLRKGIVPKNKFRGIMSLMKIDLQEDQLQTLEKVYQYDLDLTKINYFKFIQDINVVFTQSNLEKNPVTQIQNWQPPQFLDPRTILDDHQQQQFDILMRRLGECVRKHRILLLPHFQDKDKSVCGKVSFSRFRMILDFHKLPLDEQQYQLLIKRFSYEGVEFNYVEFIEVLKKYELESV